MQSIIIICKQFLPFSNNFCHFYPFLPFFINFHNFSSFAIIFHNFSAIFKIFQHFLQFSYNFPLTFTIFPQFSINFHNFLSFSINFYYFLSISTIFHSFPPFPVYFHQYSSISTIFYHFRLISTIFQQFPPISIIFQQFPSFSNDNIAKNDKNHQILFNGFLKFKNRLNFCMKMIVFRSYLENRRMDFSQIGTSSSVKQYQSIAKNQKSPKCLVILKFIPLTCLLACFLTDSCFLQLSRNWKHQSKCGFRYEIENSKHKLLI